MTERCVLFFYLKRKIEMDKILQKYLAAGQMTVCNVLLNN